MKKLAFVALLGLAAAACTTTEERVGGAAVGAGVGAVQACRRRRRRRSRCGDRTDGRTVGAQHGTAHVSVPLNGEINGPALRRAFFVGASDLKANPAVRGHPMLVPSNTFQTD